MIIRNRRKRIIKKPRYVVSEERGIWGGVVAANLKDLVSARKAAKRIFANVDKYNVEKSSLYVAQVRPDGELIRVARCTRSGCKNLKPTKVV